jgi:hypothetical protein
MAMAALVGEGQVQPGGKNPQPGARMHLLPDGLGQMLAPGMLHRAVQPALQTADAALRADDDGFHGASPTCLLDCPRQLIASMFGSRFSSPLF